MATPGKIRKRQQSRIEEPLRPTRDEIAHRAYLYSLQRGAAPGHEMDDWIQAERELIDEMNEQVAGRSLSTGTEIAHTPTRKKHPLPVSPVSLPDGTARAILDELRQEDGD